MIKELLSISKDIDLKPENILLGLEDPQLILDLIEEQKNEPGESRERQDRIVHSARLFGDLRAAPGEPKLADFGLAVRGPGPYNHNIQPNLLQAPEVILGAGWSYSADIWNLGVIV